MDEPYGEAHLGELAREQLEHARRDPRVDRSRGAMVADFFVALEEAERWREVTTWGLRELADAVTHEQLRIEIDKADAALASRRLQAAWERAEMARAELANEYPYVHAVTLVSMLSALDAMVEELVPGTQRIIASSILDHVQERLREAGRSWDEGIPEDQREAMRAEVERAIAERLPQTPKRPWGVGTQRYELLLERANLRTPPERPIPADLDEALTELVALRHVLVHRGGRIDKQALDEAPTLSYGDGEFVRLRRDDYRRYSAAVRAYGIDITQRLIPPEMRRDLSDWRSAAYVTA